MPVINDNEFVELLCGDLRRERGHLMFYLWAASQVTGLHRKELSEFFTEQAASEMQHVKQFQDVILELGGKIDQEVHHFYYKTTVTSMSPMDLLAHAFKMEEEVVENYALRIQQAEVLGGAVAKYVILFLEDQLLDSKTDAANIRRMIL